MKHLNFFGKLSLLILIAGCIPSLHGIVTEETQLKDDRILGSWILDGTSDMLVEKGEQQSEGGGSIWTFQKGANAHYDLIHSEIDGSDTLITKMEVNLTSIHGLTYMDFFPDDPDAIAMSDRFASNILFAHTFARFRIDGENLEINPFDGDYIQNLIEGKRIRLRHEVIYGDTYVLTASTSELRAFVAKYGSDQALYSDSEFLQKLN